MVRGSSDPFVERVREASDVVEIVGSQVELKRAGARFRGLCPFHQEKTPSFFVSPEHQTYHCFGCGTGGDVYSFIMSQENMTFPEALQHLADRAGIPLPERRGPSSDKMERIRQALKIAQGFYSKRLASPDGATARRYLEQRGIPDDLSARFGLGAAPDSWDGLLRHARPLLSERALIEAGLAAEGQRGVYDRFRNRLIFPIETPGGAPVGFGGRILDDGEPKYLNSPETPAYRKGSVLYGVPQAREAIRLAGRALVVEGYFDVLVLAQGGIPEVIGSCGTALTGEQAQLLRRLGVPVILLFDGDTAGVRAALRALPVVVGEVEEVRVAFPPKGLDPDDWIRSEGKDAVDQVLRRALTPVGFLEDRALAGALGRREAAAEAVHLISRIADPLSRDLWIQETSGRFGMRESAIEERLAKEIERGSRRPVDGRTAGRSPGEQGSAPAVPKWVPLESISLRVALAHPDRAAEIVEIAEMGRPRKAFVEVLQWIDQQTHREDSELLSAAGMVARAGEELPGGGGLSALSLEDGSPPPDPDSLIEELRRRGHRFLMAKVTQSIRRAEEGGDAEELARCLAEKQRLVREQGNLESATGEDRPGASIGDKSGGFETGDSVA